jgi:Spy/CpxP family protein refolding chaperone
VSSLKPYVLAGLAVALFLPIAGTPQNAVQSPLQGPARTNDPLHNGVKPGQKPHGENCAQKAGITKAEQDRRRAIQEDNRAQIAAVCDKSGLTDAERQKEIQEIAKATQEKLMATLTPEQRSTLEECQRANAADHPHPAPVANGGHWDPCTH